MTEGQVKAKLYEYREAKERLDISLLKLEELETYLTSTGIDYGNTRVTSSPRTTDRIGEMVDKLYDLQSQCIRDARLALTKMDEVCEFIAKAGDSTLEKILIQYYILGKSWEEVAVATGYVVRHIYRLKDEAIERLR